jgi:FMN-dependent NADH-azoreductase
VHGKKMVCVTSRGADYSQPPLLALDFVDTYLRTIFGFVGITDIKFFSAQPMDVSQESRRAAFRTAISDVRSWVGEGAWDATPLQQPVEVPADVKPQVIVD